MRSTTDPGLTRPVYRCLMCGAPREREPDLCSTHCRAEADLELRGNCRRISRLRRGLHVLPREGRELRALYDRNAELEHALIASSSLPRR